MISSLIIFLTVIILYTVLIGFFTAFLALTGIPKEKANFQTISLFTNCGFTTAESESMISTKRRRIITKTIMLTGNILNIGILSAFINIILSTNEKELSSYWQSILITLIVVFLLWLFFKIPKIKNFIQSIYDFAARKLAHEGKNVNTIEVVEVFKLKIVANIKIVANSSNLIETPLKELKLMRSKGIQVLAIERGTHFMDSICGDEMIMIGDVVTVYGGRSEILNTFEIKNNHKTKKNNKNHANPC